MSDQHRVRISLLLFGCLVLIMVYGGCRKKSEEGLNRPFRIGFAPNSLLAPLYVASDGRKDWEPVKFDSGGNIGYALISGDIDAGFVETEKATKLLNAPGGEKLKVIGAIEFPYGATVVLRKDLKLRLSELSGRTLAALEEDCIINQQFTKDARRHGLDPKKIKYRYMPFAEMLPALEAKAIDGALVKGAYGVLAELAGHKILYQNWQMKGGDDCCPPWIAQLEYLLIIREEALPKVKPVFDALLKTADTPPAVIRQTVNRTLQYPLTALEQYPIPAFAAVSDDLRTHLGKQKCPLIR